jgi:hypothetical protein|uniref:Uncharacterized protein n=1 Tax=viral metagenome TaxID=1070528 RepID=A0A6C0IK35_9ZZZZ
MENGDATQVLPRFGSIIGDLITDLHSTFPEFGDKFELYQQTDFASKHLDDVYQHAVKVFPERFFDILYQNVEIFQDDTNTEFLPGVDFKLFFTCEGVSEDTKKTLWKYLQLMLFMVVENVQDKSMFGEASTMFEGINQEELQSKLSEAMNGLGDLFKNIGKMGEASSEGETKDADEGEEDEASKKFKEGFEEKMGSLPNLKGIQEKLNKLFEGKIGALAKEMAEELTNDFTEVFGADMESKHSNPQDVMKQLMKDPKKLMDLMKKVSGKLNAKMESGEISKEELMKEAGDILGSMGDGEGGQDLNEMLKNMAKSMGGKLGKNMRIDTNAIDRMTKMQGQRTTIMKQHEAKKKKIAEEVRMREQQRQEQIRIQESFVQAYSLENNGKAEDLVFRIPGQQGHERSFIHPDLLKEMEEEDKNEQSNKKPSKKKKKKTKK